MKPMLLLSLGLVTLIVCLVFYERLAPVVVLAGYTLVGSLALLLLATLFLGAWSLAEKVRLNRAQRIEAEKQAHVLTITDNGETWVRDTDPKATWRNLTGTPALYVNGQQSLPAEWEIELYRLKLAALAQTRAAAQVIPGRAELLPEPAPLDLLTVFTQPTQAYAIIGGQQSGKTWQARHIAAHWARQGDRPVVIGPKWDQGEWSGCYLIGGGGDMAAVEWGINLVRRLVERRHADTGRSHKSHPIQPVFFDDWTPIVDAVPNARTLVLEATTLYASVNVLLYFILHSDTAAAWGVERKGAALKDNVVKLFITPQYDQAGLVIRSQTQGHLRFAGESVDRPVRLFNTPPVEVGRSRVITPPIQAGAPTASEAKILALHRQGASHAKICEQVWGYKSGNKYPEIEAVLAKFDPK